MSSQREVEKTTCGPQRFHKCARVRQEAIVQFSEQLIAYCAWGVVITQARAELVFQKHLPNGGDGMRASRSTLSVDRTLG